MTPPGNSVGYRISLYADGLAEPLRRFVQRVWPKSDSVQTIAEYDRSVRDFAHENVQTSPIFLFLKDEEVIGHIATAPVQLHSPSGTRAAHWVVGFFVLPEHRNGPIGPLLIKKVNDTLDLTLTLHVEEAPLNIFKGLGWKHSGIVPQFVYLQNAYSFFKNIRIDQLSFLQRHDSFLPNRIASAVTQPPSLFLVALCASTALTLWSLATLIRRPGRGSGSVVEEKTFDHGYDLLWQKVAPRYDTLVVRDRAYLEIRYARRMKNYRLLAYRQNGELLGYCILKMKQFSNDVRMGSMRVATIVDCLFDPLDMRALQSLLSSAIRLCKQEACDALFCTASYAPLQKLLALNGFIRIPGNLNFAYFDKNHNLRPDLSLGSWHLMRGDSDADGNL